MAFEGKRELVKTLSVCSDLMKELSFKSHNLIFPLKIIGRVLQKLGNFLDGYYFLNAGLKEYENSQFFDKNNKDYTSALKTKNEFYDKLPILNKFFERFKN
jgi:hypothetical protein